MPALAVRASTPYGSRMKWMVSATTDRGLQRPTNEDAHRCRPEVGLFLVADGMGGHAAGEIASTMAADIVEHATVEALEAGPTAAPIETVLCGAIRQAHDAILDHAAREPEKSGMGTTLTALLLHAETATFHIAHVGDSRAYRLRSGRLSQLTTDHTWVQQQVELGRLTALEARTHPLSSVLTHALGASGPAPEPDVVCGDLAVDDLFLLCTDGLSGMIDDADLTALLDRPIPLETIAAQLIDAANLRGGVDNITVVLVRVTE